VIGISRIQGDASRIVFFVCVERRTGIRLENANRMLPGETTRNGIRQGGMATAAPKPERALGHFGKRISDVNTDDHAVTQDRCDVLHPWDFSLPGRDYLRELSERIPQRSIRGEGVNEIVVQVKDVCAPKTTSNNPVSICPGMVVRQREQNVGAVFPGDQIRPISVSPRIPRVVVINGPRKHGHCLRHYFERRNIHSSSSEVLQPAARQEQEGIVAFGHYVGIGGRLAKLNLYPGSQPDVTVANNANCDENGRHAPVACDSNDESVRAQCNHGWNIVIVEIEIAKERD
jgi:hypothetical protein